MKHVGIKRVKVFFFSSPTQETAHIAAMVSAQKSKQVKKARPRPIRNPIQQWRPPHQQQQLNNREGFGISSTTFIHFSGNLLAPFPVN